MKFRNMAVAGISLALAFGLSACSNSTTGSTTTTTSGAPASSTSSAPAASSVDFAKDVGIVLPTNSEPRWVMAQSAFKAAMPGAQILFSQGDSAIEKTNVETLMSKGVKYIIICAQDGSAAAAAVDEAKAKGITVIAYDRLIMDTANLDYYVTFDSVAVGEAWGDYLVKSAEKPQGNNLWLYAGSADDNNAFLFFQGAWNKLQPKIADGTFTIVNSDKATAVKATKELTHAQLADIIGQVGVMKWVPDTGKQLVQANLASATKDQKGVVYALTPNDDTAVAMSDTFRADPDVTKLYNTGQDFTKASAQYILDGMQGMTVWKPDPALVQNCKDIINAVAGGNTKPSVVVTTYDNRKEQVPSTKADITVVTKDNIAQVVTQPGSPFKIDNGKVVDA
ncbi:MAG: substrate-binding domain-containing protein [Actinomycetia bacterium]|nr:substrate-binding domain-containing protein [Actinomycetes bacterium]